jgi:diguanylate cyclase (GGDEF)-like protein
MSHDHSALTQELLDIIEREHLTALFQPIIDMANGKFIGYEGHVRGPSNSLLHSPFMLYRTAKRADKLLELENLSCKMLAESFIDLKLQGFLFLRLNGEVFLDHKFKEIQAAQSAQKAGLDPQQIIITLCGQHAGISENPAFLQKIISRYAELGCKAAVEDEGEFFSMLSEQAEFLPCCVKINRYLIDDIDKNPLKVQLVKSLLKLAEKANVTTLADGIETRGEFLLAREVGIMLGQGRYIAEASRRPPRIPPQEIKGIMANHAASTPGGKEHNSIDSILEKAPHFSLEKSNEDVFQVFENNPQLSLVAVTNNRVPVGLINRSVFINRFARPYQRELYGKKSCTAFMDPEPLIVDRNISIQDLSRLLARDQRHVSLGFIFTENGLYCGVGTSQNLIHEITEMQIQSARYANPLTGLPGNTPIDERIDMLLAGQEPFCICYFDLDNFKPFNDVYGFSMGDAMIQMTAKIIAEEVNADLDFVGHIGGDDFIVLFCSADWEERCRAMLKRFEIGAMSFFSPQDTERGGYVTENRRGEKEFHNLTTLSIGAVPVKPGIFNSHRDVAVVASESKKMAKKSHGNSLFVNQRDYSGQAAGPPP